MNSPSRRRPFGLTIIETLVALLVVGVLVTVAAPSMQGLIAAQRVKGINAELVTDLQFARSEAARRNRDVIVRFRTTENCYTVFVPDAFSGDCNCSRTPNVDVCGGTSEEIKTVQIPPSTAVSLAASSPVGLGQKLTFEGQSGGSRVVNVNDTSSSRCTSSVRGQVRTTVNAAGRPTMCSPDASISSVPPC